MSSIFQEILENKEPQIEKFFDKKKFIELNLNNLNSNNYLNIINTKGEEYLVNLTNSLDKICSIICDIYAKKFLQF